MEEKDVDEEGENDEKEEGGGGRGEARAVDAKVRSGVVMRWEEWEEEG